MTSTQAIVAKLVTDIDSDTVLADRYPQLISKSADLQSRIDEAMRGGATNTNDLDFRF